MTSLRMRLFLLIVAATALVWSAAAVWTTISTRNEIEHVLDNRLREAAHMVASLGSSEIRAPRPKLLPGSVSESYQRQLACQIWSLNGQLVSRSADAPAATMGTNRTGFSERQINGTGWRVYTYIVPDTGLKVMVGDAVAMRERLITDMLAGLIAPALVGLAALAVLLWLGIERGLAPLRRVAHQLERRSAEDLSQLDSDPVPDELRVVTQAINGLFTRLEAVRESERHFLASAAHELQTPLAGLKTQAEIARRSDDTEMRARALSQMQRAIDRTTRLVRQLLDLARQESGPDAAAASPLSVQAVAASVAEELHPLLVRHTVTLSLDPSIAERTVAIEEAVLRVTLRNLIENAVLYGPSPGRVTVRMDGDTLRIEDEGDGMTPDQLATLRQRFVRGSGQRATGSGLGLSIVDAALHRAGLYLNFEATEPHGWAAVIRLTPFDRA
ncbi:two-component system sensor histidine kinase QseC [Stakelama sediminis]|uniref:histidine kinase n=1 Tax=Stakelama sediminis TaxID=463200 RepID=A0A840Z082_9SPHN|nr:histidine kinase dimerization/phospho-acceptor domain-containing protein [Stakelama sediminis]MBB5719197.1 two-component system sensor histidine kinase QseC [Stakelama sediminis]